IPLNGKNIDKLGIFIYGGASGNIVDGPCVGKSYSWIDGMGINSTTTGTISTSSNSSELSIYPNPSSGVVNITSADKKNISYELYSLVGELIAKGIIDNEQLAIHEKGVYILKLYTGFNALNVCTKKIIVIK
ncbi:MAG: T9SS type A sorting domain-containing protein, partial [Bacteroidota bacterium]